MLGAEVHDLLDEHVRSAIDDAEVDVATAFANGQVAKQLDYGLLRPWPREDLLQQWPARVSPLPHRFREVPVFPGEAGRCLL
jgi:hypothetical protein